MVCQNVSQRSFDFRIQYWKLALYWISFTELSRKLNISNKLQKVYNMLNKVKNVLGGYHYRFKEQNNKTRFYKNCMGIIKSP